MFPANTHNLNNFFCTENISSLEIVLKLTERCNIACSYCYYFFGGDESFKNRPPTFSLKKTDELINFIKRCCNSGVTKVSIVMHGGEPLLIQKARFNDICEKISTLNKLEIDLTLTIQTNGMLIDESWINIFSRFNIFVGVSIDGPENYNDMYRIDKKGQGTYQKTIEGLSKLKLAYKKKLIQKPGIISVINPDFNASIIYKHLTEELGIENLHFLYPDDTHNSNNVSSQYIKKMNEFTTLLIRSWLADPNKKVK